MNSLKINYYGTWSLLKKETLRFIKVYHQTLFSPVINVLLLLAIFSLAFGERFDSVQGVPFREFISAGLIMMAAMQNAFANSSSSFVMGKVLGHIIDYLIPPISPKEMLFAMVIGACLRGIMVGILAFIMISLFVNISIHSFFYTIFYLISGTIFLALLGMLCGIVSESFDHMSAITSYFITPLTFLSGTFYSTSNLPQFWENIAHYNPFFYIIDGFRYGISGYHDGNLSTGITITIIINIILWDIVDSLLRKGHKIKN